MIAVIDESALLTEEHFADFLSQKMQLLNPDKTIKKRELV